MLVRQQAITHVQALDTLHAGHGQTNTQGRDACKQHVVYLLCTGMCAIRYRPWSNMAEQALHGARDVSGKPGGARARARRGASS